LGQLPASRKRFETMPPFLALLVCLAFVFWLLRYDPAKKLTPSPALWVPLIWIFIVGSRLPSQWLGGGQVESALEALEAGNPLDRTVLAVLILLAIGILISRSFNWSDFFARNVLLIAFLFFALMSILWSDFPFVSFKRWFRDLGGYLVILVVLSDPHPLEALGTLLRRLYYVLIPVSLLLIKYYPQYGKQYDFWTGTSMFVGATTSKNMLGVLCLVSGIFFFCDTVTRWPDRRERPTRRIIFVNLMFIGMTFWLLHLADSATSRVCLILGCAVIAVAHRKSVRRNPFLLKVLIPVGLCLYMVLQLGFGINGALAGLVGRNSTFTGRTDLWNILLGMHTNLLLGTGYESFWLGPRLQVIWSKFAVVNEAHNGYLEIYLNLGLIGLFLLCGFLIASYRTICKRLASPSSFGSLSLALWTVLLFYNMTEAAFKGSQLMWITFLLGAISVRIPAEDRVRDVVAFDNSHAAQGFPVISQ
jgi:exopolysaccharide production protein ExoQ